MASVMLEPSRAFYMAVFGTMKVGAIAVPLFTLFGPDGVKLRVEDCTPRLIVTNAEKASLLAGSRPACRRRRRCVHDGARTVCAAFSADTPADACHFPIHLRNDARAPRSSEAYAPLDRDADGGCALRHGPAAGRSVHLPVVAGLGPWSLARHARAAGAGHHHWRLCRQVQAERLLAALSSTSSPISSAAATHYRMMRSSGAAPRSTTRSRNCLSPASRSTARRPPSPRRRSAAGG